jgi:hypothetical protein
MPKLKLPNDAQAQLRRAVRKMRKPTVVAVCLWCGYDFTEFTAEIEDMHFANACPDAPEPLGTAAVNRLGRK